ncbi:hypothetical protein AJ80_01183 [Polytolypa hystricis UAMH7299]|uniref:LysM domain-containing protein n=1 Tax=Polytolypa hystricis (strain UAMH7299) TaxID=1447883 RepID=A0A2B7YZW7_POLH7|nr:hypothetical protein AJ80_01183 [Polytolypa hystricis UAMH7299]
MTAFNMLLLFIFCFSRIAIALSIVPSLAHIPLGVRAACRVSLANNITQCSDIFLQLPEYIPSSALPEICTLDCDNALSSTYADVLSRCGTDAVDITVNDTVVGTFTPLDLAGDGFCKEALEDVTDDELCSDCYMKSIQLEINRPFQDGAYHPDDFNSLKESCGIPTTSFPVDPTTTGNPPTTTPTCTSFHTANAEDTVNSIAESLSVATDRLLTYNGLPLNFNGPFSTVTELCLDEVSKCLIHQVVAADTCSSLVTLSGDAVDEFMLQSWNPTIGVDCANLESMLGKYICIGPPGQTDKFTPVVPSTTSNPITTPTDTYTWGEAPDSLTNPINFTTTWLFPTDGPIISTVTADTPPAESVAATLERIKFCPFNDEFNSTIWDEGLDEEEYHLHSWDLPVECTDEHWDPYCYPDPNDPILPSPVDIPSSCYPTITTIIPEGWVEPPGPTHTGIPEDCNKWHMVSTGDGCASIAAKFNIPLATFYEYNPSINAQCGNLVAGFVVCVRIWVEPTDTATVTPTPTTTAGPPGPIETGTSPTCTKWHLLAEGKRRAEENLVSYDPKLTDTPSDDSCESVAAEYGIIVSRFRQLNRSVDSECNNLIVGNAYCVG